MGTTETYLAGYNLVSALGWFSVLVQCAQLLASGAAPATFWPTVGTQVVVVQSLAVMEIVHSVLGLVKSPFFTVFLQVFSRYALVYACVLLSPTAATHWGCALMVSCWSCAEVPRYLFYFFKQIGSGEVPMVLNHLRFNLFLLLYPAGVFGEIVCIVVSLPDVRAGQYGVLMPNAHNFEFTLYGFMCVAVWSYAPGLPFLYGHMLRGRKKMYAQFAKAKSA
jgi:very-long-chain (3R)-3-hydroxyacyl-CoA dehydratase